MICGKYEIEEGGWLSKEVRKRYGLGLWTIIRKNWDLLTGRMAF